MKKRTIKKIYFFILVCSIFILCLNGCKKEVVKAMNNNENSIKWINALVSIEIINGQKDYTLIEKPESKSRISYHLIDLKDEQKELLEKLNGKMVDAEIKIIEELSPWNKKAYLLRIKQ